MDEKPDQILEHIETQRSQLGSSLNELETRVRQTTDWRTHFDNNPMLVLGIAFGGGMLLGASVGGGKRGRSKYSSSKYSSPNYTGAAATKADANYYESASDQNTASSQQRRRASETLDHIKAALIAFATSKTKEFLNDALPGFEQHLTEAQKGSSSGQRTGATEQSSTSYGQQGQSTQGANYGSDFDQAGTQSSPVTSESTYRNNW